MVLGTPLYMSPEQARGDENLDHRVDLYALGVIMYECASGHVPFGGNNYLSVISQVLNEDPKPLRELRPELSEEFEAIVSKAMAKDRTHRYTSATEMLGDVTALLDDPTHSTERAKITGPRRLLVRPKIPKLAYAIGGIGLLVAAVTIAVAVLMGGGPPKKETPVVAAKLDAGVAVANAPPVDAGPPKPEAETIRVQVDSIPPHAEVFGADDGRDYGATPVVIPVVVHDATFKLIAQAPGYDDQPFAINPVAQKEKNDPVKIKLKKAVGRAPNTQVINAGSGAGSGSAKGPANHTAGDLHNDPYSGSNMPK
jgi:hypothetical protein